MSQEFAPATATLDPGSTRLPPLLEAALGERAGPLLLVVTPDSGDGHLRTVVALAESLAGEGHPTTLASFSEREAAFRDLLGVQPEEGLADVLLFGASLEHVRTRPLWRSFDFVARGSYLPDVGDLIDRDRFGALAHAIQREDERMLLFVTAGDPFLEPLSRLLGRAVLIGHPTDVEPMTAALDPECRVLAIVEPSTGIAATGADHEADADPDGADAAQGGDPELTQPVVVRDDSERRRTVSPILWILLALTLALGAWFLYSEYYAPSQAPAQPVEPAREQSVSEAAGAPEPVARGDAVSTPLPISVAVEAHQDLEMALERAAALQAQEPDVLFFLAPVAVRDIVYFRLMGGPLATRAAGEALMAQLVDAGHKSAPDDWSVRTTALAFDLGEFDSIAEATTRQDSLVQLGIPSYVVPTAFESGPPRYRLYGGAYESRGEAEVMRQMLSDAGIESELVERTGQPLPGDS